MLSTGNQVINTRAAGHTQPVPVAASSQVYVVSPSAQPHLVSTGESLEVEDVVPRIRSTENWVLSTSDSLAPAGSGTLRGYPGVTAAGGTLRGHPGGLLQEDPSNEVVFLYTPPQELSLPVVLQGAQNIDMAISNFHIKFDNKDRFKPGEEISGQVTMDVWSNIHIKFVEFIIQGKGTVRVFKDTSTFLEKPRNEVYLDKKIILIGPQNGSLHGVTLTPGRYVSSFRYRLPETLPPTVHQFDMGHGYVFDISYEVQAHVCDKVRSKHLHGGTSSKMVRMVKVTKKKFTMTALKDWQNIPGAMEPIVHAEQLQLFMSRSSKEPTSVLYNLNRAVYPIGDNIKLKIEVFHPKKRKVKNVQAELEQQTEFSKDTIRKFRRILIKAIDNQTMRHTTDHENMVRSQFSIPVPPNLVPSYLPHCHMLDISYTLKVIIRFRHLGGDLMVRLPIIIAPASDAERNIDSADVPVFNKPIMQFPYFSKSPIIPDMNGFSTLGRSSKSGTESGHETMRSHGTVRSYAHSNGTIRSNYGPVVANGTHKKSRVRRKPRQFERNDKVTTKYKPGINCCSCWALCFGYGIYESS